MREHGSFRALSSVSSQVWSQAILTNKLAVSDRLVPQVEQGCLER